MLEKIGKGTAATRAGSCLAVAAASVLLLPYGAFAAEPTPGSTQGGTPGPSAPADLKVTTELPAKISVDNKTGKTKIAATVANKGAKASGGITLAVVGFDGLKIDAVPGCTPIPAGKLPKGSRSGFSCTVADLAAGTSKSYAVDATFDLRKKGRICLPVTEGTSGKLLWQQGPVDFGTTTPTPNAPDTPLLLNTVNVPLAPDAPSPAPGGTKPPARPGDLPDTGVGTDTTLLGGAGALLLAAGGAGFWWSRRERSVQQH
ncbi:LPXTG cell wall anchor domain-containing protein [Streptomyces sp. NPDC058657]|uniref:LPXTG cell wall anchor domain-containing protein n=1 Tax=unclassified Streptomyces TaxID=2593676 RepID=UPI003664E1FA